MTQSATAPTTSPTEIWRLLRGAHIGTARALDRALEQEHNLGLSGYELLARLHAAGAPVRLGEIAQQTGLSPSRVTRLVDHLAGRGFVHRKDCPSDSRGRYVMLASGGEKMLLVATVTYENELRSSLFARFTPDEYDALTTALAPLQATCSAADELEV